MTTELNKASRVAGHDMSLSVLSKAKSEAIGESTTGTVSIVGLGYVGLPLACLCAGKDYATYGIDISQRRIEAIKNGNSPIDDGQLKETFNRVKFTADFRVVRNTDIVVICVPTPLDEYHCPDFGSLISACRAIAANLRRGHLIIVESTVSPGTCQGTIQPILEASGLKVGRDFDIAHCPERIDPGNKRWSVSNVPRVLGATSPEGLSKALSFYRSILEADVIPMKSIKEAEATKVVENAFRDLNIAFVNELAKSFDKMGIDVTEVIKAASTKPYAFLSHYPGCGVGGDCIPVSPWYLIRRAEEYGFDHKLLRLAREINKSMPEYTVQLLFEALAEIGTSNGTVNIGILGLSHKADVSDMRLSPAYEIIDLLRTANAKVQTYDPLVPEQSTVKSLDELLEKSEALVLVTPHREFVNMNLDKLKDNKIKVVIDGRNCLDKGKIQKLGVTYRGIGR